MRAFAEKRPARWQGRSASAPQPGRERALQPWHQHEHHERHRDAGEHKRTQRQRPGGDLRAEDGQRAASLPGEHEPLSGAERRAADEAHQRARRGILRRAGFSNTQAVATFSGIIALNYGWSSFTTARDLDTDSPGHDVGAMLAGLPRTEYPLIVDVANEMGAYGSDHHYDLVLEQLLDGLRATADVEPG